MKNLAVNQGVAINLTPKVISDQECFSAFLHQLKMAGLPFEDLDKDKHLLVGYYENENLIGTGGVEIYGDFGLLRSVSVVGNYKGKKIGSKITMHLIDKAKESNLKGLYLLTETAPDFFQKFGFDVTGREHVANEVKNSKEFTHVCPVSAVCMYLHLESQCCKS